MTQVQRTALVERPAEQLYELVLDVPSYPEFLPWCKASKVIEQGGSEQVASVTIDAIVKQVSFTTRNSLTPHSRINLQLLDGPFRSLHGEWRFKPLSEAASKAELDIEFEFASGALALAIKPVFLKIADTMLDAFVARAMSMDDGVKS